MCVLKSRTTPLLLFSSRGAKRETSYCMILKNSLNYMKMLAFCEIVNYINNDRLLLMSKQREENEKKRETVIIVGRRNL